MAPTRKRIFHRGELRPKSSSPATRNATDERLKQVMAVITRKLHEAVKEIEPTQEEWFGGDPVPHRDRPDLQRLAAGVHPAVRCPRRLDAGRRDQQPEAFGRLGEHGARTVPRRRCARTADGRQYLPRPEGRGCVRRMAASSTPRARPIAGAMLDVWQANDEGFYDVQQKGIQPDFNLRGVFRTGADGRYWFRAVKPKFYPIPDDGPVGKLLQRARPPSLSSGASAFHPRGRWLRRP